MHSQGFMNSAMVLSPGQKVGSFAFDASWGSMRRTPVFGYVGAGLVGDRDGHNRGRTDSPEAETHPHIEITPRVITERGNSSEQLGLR